MAENCRHETGALRADDGCPLFYQAWWPEGEPVGTIVLVHGLGEHSDRYPHLCQALIDVGYILAAFDLRGHGRSGGRKGHIGSFDEFRSDLALALEHFRSMAPDLPLFVYGHSLGSVITLDYVLRGGDGLRGIILSGAALDASQVAPVWQVAILKGLSRVWPTFSLKVALPGALLSRDPAVCGAYDSDPLVHWTRSARSRRWPRAGGDRVAANRHRTTDHGRWTMDDGAPLGRGRPLDRRRRWVHRTCRPWTATYLWTALQAGYGRIRRVGQRPTLRGQGPTSGAG